MKGDPMSKASDKMAKAWGKIGTGFLEMLIFAIIGKKR